MDNIARRIKEGCENAGITKRVTSHGLRHTFCTHSIESGVPIHFVAQLMGHDSIETLQPYIHASVDGATASKSPIEMLPEKAQKPPLEDMLRNPKPNLAEKPKLRIFA